MIPYINIHTHHLSKDNGVFLFNNCFGTSTGLVTKLYLEKYFSIGVHPWDADLNISFSEFESVIQNINCLAIGECGLDKLKGPDLEIQKTIFISQLDLAVKYQMPVIIHCVKAFDELIEVCQAYHSKVPLIIHGFNKSSQLAKQLIDKGFYISWHHSVFDKTEYDLSQISLNKIFLETDDTIDRSIIDIYQKATKRFHHLENDLKEKIYTNFTALFKNYGR